MMLTERIELIRYVKEGGKSIRSIYECLLALIGFIRGEGERDWIVRNEKKMMNLKAGQIDILGKLSWKTLFY